jgi:uncharacterized membrane protein
LLFRASDQYDFGPVRQTGRIMSTAGSSGVESIWADDMSPSRTRVGLILGAIIVLGTALRFYQLDEKSLWLDESYSYWLSNHSLHDIWHVIAAWDVHPPMYFTLLKFWRGGADSEFVMRGLSVVAGVATIPAVYVLARQCGERGAGVFIGLMAAGMFAVSPLHIDFAQQARPYTLLALGISVALAGATWLLAHPGDMRRRLLGLGTPAFVAWLALILGAASALWLHNTAAVFLASLGVVGLAIIWRDGFSAPLLVNIAIAVTAVLLLWSPFLVMFVGQVHEVARDIWIPELTVTRALSPIATIVDIGSLTPLTFVPIMVILLVLGAKAMARSSRARLAWLLLGVIGLSYAAIVAFSFLVQSVVVPRVFVWMNVPCLVIVAAGLASLKRPAIRHAGMIAVAGVSLLGVWNFRQAPDREPWRDMAADLAENVAEGGVVLTVPSTLTIPLNYYLDRLEGEVALVGLPDPSGTGRRTPEGTLMVYPDTPEAALPIIDTYLEWPSEVWFVGRLMPMFDPDNTALTRLRAHRSERAVTEITNYMVIHRFE